MSRETTFNLDLTKEEIDQLATWHKECEKRFADMREYESAQRHKDRTYLFCGLQKTGKYLSAPPRIVGAFPNPNGIADAVNETPDIR